MGGLHTRRQFLGGSIAGTFHIGREIAGPVRPNFLFLMTDSLRAECLGCYGNRVIHTPHLDGLARDGVRFSRSFAQHTVCMPTRSTLFTGRYPHVHGVWANGVPLARTEVTLPQVLSAAGYHTWMAGKLHLEPLRLKNLPADGGPYYGFQRYLISDNDLTGPYLDFVREKFPSQLDAVQKHHPGVPIEAHQTTWIADRTIDFLRSRRNAPEPFFAFASFIDPVQTEYNPPAPFDRMYRPDEVPPPQRKRGELDREPPYKRIASQHLRARGLLPEEDVLRRTIARYYGAASFVDAAVGRILNVLEGEGLGPKTVVVFTVDHGEMLGDHWLRLKGPWMYDVVIQTPMIWRCPARFPGHLVVEDFAEQVDVMPTILDLAGLAAPPGVQGRSLAPLLEGRHADKWRSSALIEDRNSSELVAHGIEERDLSLKTIRTRDWKLTFYQGRPYGELFDLRNDPLEFENLWDHPARLGLRQDLIAQLLDRYAAADDPLPERLAPA